MTRVLVSGFEAFGTLQTNISESVVRILGDWRDFQITTVVLPVTFGTAWELLENEIKRSDPELVLALGVAETRSVITPELLAINYMNARIPDNRGETPRHRPIDPDGPNAYFTRLPAARITEALVQEGFSATLSYSAGAFVCNYLMYRMLHAASTRPLAAGFMHLPGRIELPGGLSDMKRAVELTVETALRPAGDSRKLPGG